jgi:hypothetical protein
MLACIFYVRLTFISARPHNETATKLGILRILRLRSQVAFDLLE